MARAYSRALVLSKCLFKENPSFRTSVSRISSRFYSGRPKQEELKNGWSTYVAITTVAAAVVSGLYAVQEAPWWRPTNVRAEAAKLTKETEVFTKHSPTNAENRIISRAEVARHDSLEKRVWVTRGRGVYDVTDFVKVHPGGERILLAAGRSVDPFWKVFTVHGSAETAALLEGYRVGTLEEGENEESRRLAEQTDADSLARLFVAEPVLDPSHVVRSARPCNAESGVESLKSYLTPNDLFYVRNHLPVPAIEEDEFRLGVELPDGSATVRLSLDELKTRYRKHTLTATLQCAGNRRKSMHDVKSTKGLLWDVGAIGNATWAGAKLSDVLADVGFDAVKAIQRDGQNGDEEEVAHVWLDGAEGYGASIPLEKVADPMGDVLLAYEMNGEPIPTAHGYPLRAIVPGHVAARSVKWVNKITLSTEESPSHWQRQDYKGFSPSATLEESDYDRSESIQEMPVQSAILSPTRDTIVRVLPPASDWKDTFAASEIQCNRDQRAKSRDLYVRDTLPVQGYAWSGGGRGIVRVDVSVDGGRTWTDATLLRTPSSEDEETLDATVRAALTKSELRNAFGPAQRSKREWAWTLWQADIPISQLVNSSKNDTLESEKNPAAAESTVGKKVEIVCKAVDTGYNTQPEGYEGIYNVRGVLVNAWHRVPIDIDMKVT